MPVHLIEMVIARLEATKRRMLAIMRCVLLFPLALLIGSPTIATAAASADRATSVGNQAEILRTLNETGATMATLNDWRAILLVALVLCALLLFGFLGVVFMSFRTITHISTAMGGIRDAISSNTLALSRIESGLGPRNVAP